jgi:hypothetical protein
MRSGTTIQVCDTAGPVQIMQAAQLSSFLQLDGASTVVTGRRSSQSCHVEGAIGPALLPLSACLGAPTHADLPPLRGSWRGLRLYTPARRGPGGESGDPI